MLAGALPACLQVRSHAVEVLQKRDDEELLYYLLQLVQVGGRWWAVVGRGWGQWWAGARWLPERRKRGIHPAFWGFAPLTGPATRGLLPTAVCPPQALRYEAADDSRLAAFLVARARRSLTVASFLFWYLLTELGDDSFGPRASIVQVQGRGRGGVLTGWLASRLAAPASARATCLPPCQPRRPRSLYAT